MKRVLSGWARDGADVTFTFKTDIGDICVSVRSETDAEGQFSSDELLRLAKLAANQL